eukprot:1342747-Amphidinium_carterae.1
MAIVELLTCLTAPHTHNADQSPLITINLQTYHPSHSLTYSPCHDAAFGLGQLCWVYGIDGGYGPLYGAGIWRLGGVTTSQPAPSPFQQTFSPQETRLTPPKTSSLFTLPP